MNQVTCSMEDLLTIALPVYNRTEFIKSAIDSAVKQTVKCRILIIDNHSPHNEIKEIVDGYNNPLIRYVKTKETVPLEENFNNCFLYTQTPWVTILHDDDMLHIQFVELAQKILKEFPAIGGFAVKSHVGQVEWEGIYKKVDFTTDIKLVRPSFFYFANLTPFVGVLLNRERALAIGGFNKEQYPIADFDFWYRYSAQNKLVLINQQLAYYRVSSQQITKNVVDDLITKVYHYRLNLLKKSRHPNLLAYLALEGVKLDNIKYYQNAYPGIILHESIRASKRFKIAEMLLKYKLPKKLVNFYKRKVSFDLM
jgi:glycosyltransferase involved in cell wall biosynthesis